MTLQQEEHWYHTVIMQLHIQNVYGNLIETSPSLAEAGMELMLLNTLEPENALHHGGVLLLVVKITLIMASY
jgi:hypothetical protein